MDAADDGEADTAAPMLPPMLVAVLLRPPALHLPQPPPHTASGGNREMTDNTDLPPLIVGIPLNGFREHAIRDWPHNRYGIDRRLSRSVALCGVAGRDAGGWGGFHVLTNGGGTPAPFTPDAETPVCRTCARLAAKEGDR